MEPDELIRRLMATFLTELDEHVHALNEGLLELEKAPPAGERDELVRTLFRTAHSLKGAARSVNISPVEAACHALEELLGAARDGELELGPTHFQLGFDAADAIGEAGARLRAGEPLSDAPLTRLQAQLEGAAHGSTSRMPLPPLSVITDAEEPTDEAEPSGQPQLTGFDASSVRVPAHKLDTLLAQSGELLLTRHNLESRRGELVALHEFAENWSSEWRSVEAAVSILSDTKASPDRAVRSGARSLLRRSAVLERAGNNLRRLSRDLERVVAAARRDERSLGQALLALDGEIRSVRLLPFSEACRGLERAARDLAKEVEKEVEVRVVGGQVELDRSILEALKDPLLHLVRNAVGHGIELPGERRALAKPTAGRVTMSAEVKGSTIEIVVSDDGRGLDLQAIRMKALKRKLAVPEADEDLSRLVLLPGFSTTPFLTEVSGRGVGLDVVATTVERLRGSVDIASEPGAGARFKMTLPLTLTTLRGLLVRVGGRTWVFDVTTVTRIVRVGADDLRSARGRDVLILGATPCRLGSLAGILGLSGREPVAVEGRLPVLIVKVGDQEVGLAVDELIAEQDVLIKSLGRRLVNVPHVAAATILADGEVALILDSAQLVRAALGQGRAGILEAAFDETSTDAKKRILVVDDSVTTRSLIQTVLEAAGYDVTVAVDGADGWRLLQDQGADLVVTDIEMPRMDGFALTENIRGTEQWRDMPVVLVSARSTDHDKVRGMEAGANAYLVKSAFDQKSLLDSISQLI